MIFEVVVQLLSHVQLFVTPWTAACQASLSFTISWSLLKLMTTESVMHPTILSTVVPFSSCLQSFPASGSSHQVAKVLEFFQGQDVYSQPAILLGAQIKGDFLFIYSQIFFYQVYLWVFF